MSDYNETLSNPEIDKRLLSEVLSTLSPAQKRKISAKLKKTAKVFSDPEHPGHRWHETSVKVSSRYEFLTNI